MYMELREIVFTFETLIYISPVIMTSVRFYRNVHFAIKAWTAKLLPSNNNSEARDIILMSKFDL